MIVEQHFLVRYSLVHALRDRLAYLATDWTEDKRDRAGLSPNEDGSFQSDGALGSAKLDPDLPILYHVHLLASSVLHGDQACGGERRPGTRRYDHDGPKAGDLLHLVVPLPFLHRAWHVTCPRALSLAQNIRLVQPAAHPRHVHFVRPDYVRIRFPHSGGFPDQKELSNSSLARASAELLRRVHVLWASNEQLDETFCVFDS